MGNFAFARATWPSIAEEAQRAEHYTHGDPWHTFTHIVVALAAVVENLR